LKGVTQVRGVFDLRLMQIAGVLAWVLAPPEAECVSAFWFAVAAIVSAIASIGAGVMAYQQSQTAAKNAEDMAAAQAAAQRSQAEAEAARLRNQAQQEQLDRAAAERSEREDDRRRRAAMESGYAGSGVLLEGTPAYWLQAQAGVDEYNAQARNQESLMRQKGMLWEAEMAEWQGETGATSSLVSGKAEAKAVRAQGQAALIGGIGSSIGTAATLGSSWLQARPAAGATGSSKFYTGSQAIRLMR